MVGVAVNVNACPEQLDPLDAITTEGVTALVTVMVKALLVAVLVV